MATTEKEKLRSLKVSFEDLGIMKPPTVSSTAPPRVRLMRMEGASGLPPSVAPPPCLSNSDEDAVMETELPVLFLKSIQNFDMPSLSDSKGKTIVFYSGKLNRPFGVLWDVDKPPLKMRMKRLEASSLIAQGCRYCLRPRRL